MQFAVTHPMNGETATLNQVKTIGKDFLMKKILQKLYHFSYKFVQIFSLVLMVFLFLGAFLSTCYATDMESQKVLTKTDNPLLSLLGMLIFITVLAGICRFVCKKPENYKRILLFLVLGLCTAEGIILILFSKTVPAADCMSVYSIAQSLASGDTSVIHPTASYLSYYPQQVGLTAYFEGIIRLLNLFSVSAAAYHFIKCINVAFACMIILFQYKTVHFLWNSDKTDCTYLLLAGLNLPLIFYSSFVYGEIPSFAAVSVGIYYLSKWLHGSENCPVRRSVFYTCASVISLSISVMLRKNSLILIIAVLLVVLCRWMQTKKPVLLLYGLLCAVCCFSILPIIQAGYEKRAGNTLSSGVPAMSYFAMGMQEASRGNGWYNGFNFNTYQESGMDTSVTVEKSKEAIAERVTFFKENPGYAAGFYLQKHLSQWADGTYACRQATLASGGRTAFFNSLYEGKCSYYIISYCNVYQNVLYLGALLFCVLGLFPKLQGSALESLPESKKTDACVFGLTVYLGLIGIIGGFLFHIIWEANSRYIFLYGLLLLPYAARGIAWLTERIPLRKKAL